MRSILPLFSVLAGVVSLHAASTATPATASAPAKAPTVTSTTTTPAAQSIEKAPANFPLTLRGFFGKGDKAEISVQDNASGKSVWLKPGEAHAGWELESADTAKGRAVFSQGKRRVSVFQAGERHEPAETTPDPTPETSETPAPKLKSLEDSVVLKKLHEVTKDPECTKLMNSLENEALTAVKKSHPEFFGENGAIDYTKPGAHAAQAVELNRILLATNTPAAESLKPVVTPLIDAMTKTFAPAPPGEAVKPMSNEEYQNATRRTFELADELYRQRTGGK